MIHYIFIVLNIIPIWIRLRLNQKSLVWKMATIYTALTLITFGSLDIFIITENIIYKVIAYVTCGLMAACIALMYEERLSHFNIIRIIDRRLRIAIASVGILAVWVAGALILAYGTVDGIYSHFLVAVFAVLTDVFIISADVDLIRYLRHCSITNLQYACLRRQMNCIGIQVSFSLVSIIIYFTNYEYLESMCAINCIAVFNTFACMIDVMYEYRELASRKVITGYVSVPASPSVKISIKDASDSIPLEKS